MDLPLREIVFEVGENGEGVFAMSAVESPAIKKACIHFSSVKKTNLSVQNEEKRIVFGPALIPDMKVYRNIDGYEFDLTVSKDTIEKIAVDFVQHNRANNVNLEHQDNLIGGVTMYQFFLTDEHTAPTMKGYEDLPVGTWFIGAKVNNDQVWEDFKAGKYTGWSIHAMFKSKPVNMSFQDNENDLKLILRKILNNKI